LKIYLLTQDVNWGYDKYDACVVVANSEEEARNIHPGGDDWETYLTPLLRSWANSPEEVKAEEIGETDKFSDPCIILASYNAG